MKYVKVIIIKQTDSRSGTTEQGKAWQMHNFLAHETDSEGSRIPVVLSTRNQEVVNILSQLKDKETLIPFDNSRVFANKESFNVSDELLRQAISKAS